MRGTGISGLPIHRAGELYSALAKFRQRGVQIASAGENHARAGWSLHREDVRHPDVGVGGQQVRAD
ncbi:MAG: hypothetical protein M3Y35_10195, partial [Actinomycetota bacterium]|nr:hypothetical protein [Actinomycetota bacterium]